MGDDQRFPLSEIPVHLGPGAVAILQPRFTGEIDWYQSYEARTVADGAEGRLVTMHTFAEPWDSWEVHPLGEELVVCMQGAVTFFQEMDGQTRSAVLRAGEALINPRGVWHTADVDGAASVLFVTPGLGTEHRSR
jgi:quercetin dioxygenase-like cupin family protein